LRTLSREYKNGTKNGPKAGNLGKKNFPQNTSPYYDTTSPYVNPLGKPLKREQKYCQGGPQGGHKTRLSKSPLLGKFFKGKNPFLGEFKQMVNLFGQPKVVNGKFNGIVFF